MNTIVNRYQTLSTAELDQDNQLFLDIVEKIGERLRECEDIGLQISVVAHTPRERPLSQKFQINVGHNSYPALFVDVSNKLLEGPVVRVSEPAEDYYDQLDFADYTIDTSDMRVYGVMNYRIFSSSEAFINASKDVGQHVSPNTPEAIDRYAWNVAQYVEIKAENMQTAREVKASAPALVRA